MKPTLIEAPEEVEPTLVAELILVEGPPSAVEEGIPTPRAPEEGASAKACPPSTEEPSVL